MKKGVVVVLVSVIVVLFGTGIFFYNKYSEEINLIQELERDANILFAQLPDQKVVIVSAVV